MKKFMNDKLSYNKIKKINLYNKFFFYFLKTKKTNFFIIFKYNFFDKK